MGFHEKVHAWLAAKYYQRLTRPLVTGARQPLFTPPGIMPCSGDGGWLSAPSGTGSP